MINNIWVYDLEQFKNFHSGTFYNIDTAEIKQFVIHNLRNDYNEYMNFLKTEVDGLIGYNNINYDYPLLHYLITTGNYNDSFNKSQEIISSEFPQRNKKDVIIPQLDLFRIWHFNNKARITSLKKLEVNMKWQKVQDLPFKYDSIINTIEEIDEILEYNLNDVLATYEFYKHSESVIKLRKGISKSYGINVMNKPDAGMGEDIFASILSKELEISLPNLKKMRTHRESINLNDCILPYVKYNSKEFNTLLNKIKSTIITDTKGVFDNLSVIYKGFQYDFGTGKPIINCPFI